MSHLKRPPSVPQAAAWNEELEVWALEEGGKNQLYDTEGQPLDIQALAQRRKLKQLLGVPTAVAPARQARPSARPPSVPAEAQLDEESGHWRLTVPSATGGSAQTFWSADGTLLMRREVDGNVTRALTTYYPTGALACERRVSPSGAVLSTSLFPDGRPWCTSSFNGDLLDPSVPRERMLTERLYRRDGHLAHETSCAWESGLAIYRERGPGGTIRFENLRLGSRRELRLFSSGGALELTLKLKNGSGVVVLHTLANREVLVTSSELGEATRREELEEKLGPLLVPGLGPELQRPITVVQLTREHPWADEALDSVATLLTCLATPVRPLHDFARAGLERQLVGERLAQALPTVLALAASAPSAFEPLLVRWLRAGVMPEDELAKLLRFEHPLSVRAAALETMVAKRQRPLGLLHGLLDELEPTLRLLAALALAEEDASAVEPVLASLIDADEAARASVDQLCQRPFDALLAEAIARARLGSLFGPLVAASHTWPGPRSEELYRHLLAMAGAPPLVPPAAAAAFVRSLQALERPAVPGAPVGEALERMAEQVERGLPARLASDGPTPLGEVRLVTGTLVIGALGAIDRWAMSPAELEADDWIDLVAAGPNGNECLAAFVKAGHGHLLHDVSQERAEEISARFEALAQANGWEARLDPAPERLSHTQRCQQYQEAGLGWGAFSLGRGEVSCVFKLPAERRLEVRGVADSRSRRWRSVSVLCSSAEPMRRTRVGTVSADSMLVLVDPGALGEWEASRSLDGGFDVQILEAGARGKERCAERDVLDLPPYALPPAMVAECRLDGAVVRTLLHTSGQRLRREAAKSSLEAGGIPLGASRCFGLLAQGAAVPVYVEHDEHGAVCRVTIDFEPENTLPRAEALRPEAG